jgi:M6 family metalloprotease-like protein
MKIASKVSLVLLIVLSLAGFATGRSSAAPAADALTLTGMFATTWADSPQGEGLPPRFDLYDAQGNDYLLNLSPDTVAAAGGYAILDGTQVTVEGEFDLAALDQSGNPAFNVANIIAAGETSGLANLTGSKPWVVLLCKYADNNTAPRAPAFFRGLFGNTFPGIGDYWSRVSYGSVNLDGSYVTPSWLTLPHARSYYVGSSANLQALTNDCTGVADASVNFSQFSGVAMMFNGELDGYAWGGMTAVNRDGIGGMRAAWMPPWGYENQNVLGHEVGHGFGLPHSSGPYNQTYDSPWDVMSAWPPCGSHQDPNYGCIGVETISYHRYILGWLPSTRIFTATAGINQNIVIERLGQPTNPSGSYLMAIVPIQGSSTRFYTVEARRHIDSVEYTDYEEEIMGNAIVIHAVDTTRGERTAQVVDSDGDGDVKDAGSMWTVGETFTNAGADISISVLSSTSTGYVVNVRNGGIANDRFATPKPITSYPFSTSLDTSQATSESSDPTFACANTQGTGSVWYKFTPTVRGIAEISTVGSDYNTLLAVWTGSAGSLTSVACDDDTGGNGASSLSAIILQPDTTYYIEAAGKTTAGTLNFNLAFTPCYRLTKTASPSGTGTVNANPAPNCGGSYYLKATSVQLSASPTAGKRFKSWSGAVTGTNSAVTVVMGGARTVTANFIQQTPSLVSPVGGSAVESLRPMLDWSDVTGATYSIQYSRYSNFSSATSLTATSSSIRTSSNLAKNVTYYWRVRSTADGLNSTWRTGSFRSANPPSTPSLLSPANGAAVVALQPTLDWSNSTNYPAGYQVQVSSSSTFSSNVIDLNVAGSNYAIPSPLSSGATYYWRVRSFNGAWQYSNWSPVFRFTPTP